MTSLQYSYMDKEPVKIEYLAIVLIKTLTMRSI